jgi:hypothetical protein
MAKIAIDFYDKFQVPVTKYAFVKIIAGLVKKKTITPEDSVAYGRLFAELEKIDISDHAYILDELIKFIKNREWKALIEDAVKKHLPAGNFDAIEARAQAIAGITTTGEIRPYFYWDDKAIEKRTERRLEETKFKRIGISTGIKKMDDTLYKGGWYQKELYLIMAPPKRGKSMALYWFANVATWQGFNAAVFSCENSTEIIEDRVDAMNANIETKRLPDSIKAVAEKLKSKKPDGELIVFEYPTNTLTCAEIERQIKKIELEKGIKIDMIVVDYLDIMKPLRRREDRLVEEADICKGLRALAGKFVVPVLSATQVNRQGSDKTIITGKDVRGTWDKIADADTIITLSATADELSKNQLRVHFSESRNNESKTFVISTAYNMGRFYKEFLREEF